MNKKILALCNDIMKNKNRTSYLVNDNDVYLVTDGVRVAIFTDADIFSELSAIYNVSYPTQFLCAKNMLNMINDTIIDFDVRADYIKPKMDIIKVECKLSGYKPNKIMYKPYNTDIALDCEMLYKAVRIAGNKAVWVHTNADRNKYAKSPIAIRYEGLLTDTLVYIQLPLCHQDHCKEEIFKAV